MSAHASRIALAAALVLLALLPTTSDAASPAARRIFSSVSQSFYNYIHPWEAARMARGGVRTVRFSFDWYGVEARQGTYNWTRIDKLVGNLASQGIRTEAVLFGTPSWAVPDLPPHPVDGGPSGPGDTAYPPVLTTEAVQGWKSFLRAAVLRYGPGGSYWSQVYPLAHGNRRSLPITTWQVWNEPTIADAFWPRPSAHRYGELLKISANAIRAADPRATVAIAGVPGRIKYRGISFIDDLYRDYPAISRYFDVMAFHPYSPTVRGVVVQLRNLRRALRRHGDPRVPLWVSEIGWGSGNRAGHHSFLDEGYRGQARMLQKAFQALLKRRQRLRLWQVTWFDWRDPRQRSTSCSWCTRAGLVDWHNRRKPAWDAYRSFLGH
jgi:hypothetical protein